MMVNEPEDIISLYWEECKNFGTSTVYSICGMCRSSGCQHVNSKSKEALFILHFELLVKRSAII